MNAVAGALRQRYESDHGDREAYERDLAIVREVMNKISQLRSLSEGSEAGGRILEELRALLPKGRYQRKTEDCKGEHLCDVQGIRYVSDAPEDSCVLVMVKHMTPPDKSSQGEVVEESLIDFIAPRLYGDSYCGPSYVRLGDSPRS